MVTKRYVIFTEFDGDNKSANVATLDQSCWLFKGKEAQRKIQEAIHWKKPNSFQYLRAIEQRASARGCARSKMESSWIVTIGGGIWSLTHQVAAVFEFCMQLRCGRIIGVIIEEIALI